MTRFAPLLVAALFAVGCNKPTKEDCRKAIENMRVLMHTQQLQIDVEGEVRRCNGGSKKEAVSCAIKATTLDELRACKFMHIPDDIGSAGSATGSATGAGSATGSGSATESGSATGSAAGSAAGSASGSADAGSAAAGSAGSAGSAAGSAGSAAGSAGSAAGSGSSSAN